MPPRLSKEMLDLRAQEARGRWVGEVGLAHDLSAIECLDCGEQRLMKPARPNNCRCSGTSTAPLTQAEWQKRATSRGLEFLEIVKTANTKTLCRCRKCGYQWKVIPNRITQGGGCPKCAGSLKITQAEWQERAAHKDFEFLETVRHANNPTLARCFTGQHEWSPRPNRALQGHGCPTCGQVKGSEARRLTDDVWNSRAAKLNLEWLEPVRAAQTKTLCRCRICRHEWKVKPCDVDQGHGCPACNHGGLKPEIPTLIYLLRNPFDFAKVGVMNVHTDRLNLHRRNGYTVEQTWEVSTGRKALKIEAAVLSWWREDLELPPAIRSGDGWTETVSLLDLSMDLIQQRIDRLIREID